MKSLLKVRAYSEALNVAAQMLRDPATLASITRLTNLGGNLSQIPREHLAAFGLVHKKIAILSGYTASTLVPLIRVACFRLGIDAEVLETPYGGLESLLLTRDRDLAAFHPDFCYFCVGTEHLQSDDVEVELRRWTNLWREAKEFLGCPSIMNTFVEPVLRVSGNYDLQLDSETRRVKELNLALIRNAPPFVYFCDIDHLAGYYGRSRWLDQKYYDLAKLPVSSDYAFVYAQNIARVIGAAIGRSKKCLVLDLDNTLWGGVIGDDGVAGIEIGEDSGNGEAYKRLQIYVKQLKERGVILAVCSKNELDTAREPFVRRTDMVLKLEDFSCFVANWEPKHENLVRIAQELNIGLDSLVFLDDNPAEQAIVRTNLPMVEVVPLNAHPADYAAILSREGYFETVSVTDEDRFRTSQYLENQERVKVELAFSDYGDYLKSLEMKALVEEFHETNIPRITQLINKSNQFNLTTKRYSESDVRSMASSSEWITRSVKLKDKFGDNGLIAVLIARIRSNSEAEIDTLLMSCRVLKRNVEQLIFREVTRALRDRGVTKLNGTYVPTAKNALVKDLLSDLHMVVLSSDPSGQTTYVMDLSNLRAPDGVWNETTHIEQISQGEY